MDLNHLSTRSGLTHLQVPLMVSPGFFCRLSVVFRVFSIICYGEFCLHVATNLFCVFVFCSEISGLSNVPHGEDQFGFTHFDPQLFPLCNRNRPANMCSMNQKTKSTLAVRSLRIQKRGQTKCCKRLTNLLINIIFQNI